MSGTNPADDWAARYADAAKSPDGTPRERLWGSAPSVSCTGCEEVAVAADRAAWGLPAGDAVAAVKPGGAAACEACGSASLEELRRRLSESAAESINQNQEESAND